MYAPASLTSCCTALIHVLFQNPAALVLLGLIGISSVVSSERTDVPNSAEQQCLVHVHDLDFAKGSDEKKRLEDLTNKALQEFEKIPLGSPSENLVSEVLKEVGRLSGGTCLADVSSVMSDPDMMRQVMTLYFLDLVSTARDLREAIDRYKKDTGQ
ncbi:MAG: hypothetical protein IPK84_00360 [Candidatus Moraniibacteriota bacterium]|nr:MAG: hypothetical protein IPK84_00360 [Candidatus Moranbacteria bacterium]